jgi:hypothetical protein
MRALKTPIAMALVGLAVAGVGRASFHVDKDAPPVCDGRKVTAIGTGTAVPVKGFGHSVQLGLAAGMILPPGWVRSIDKSVSRTHATWKAGEAWTEALTNVEDPNVCFVIDWHTHTFYASRDIEGMKARVAMDDPADIAPASSDFIVHARYVYPGSLRQQVANWAEAAGYSLEWHAPDYVVQKRTRIAGDMANALHRVMRHASEAAGVRYQVHIQTNADVVRVSKTAPPKARPKWSLHPGGLKAQLEAWAVAADYQVVWRAPDDFKISTSANLAGTFPEVVEQVVDALHAAGSPIAVKLYEGNHTMLVKETF